MAAVKQNGMALRFANEELRDKRDIVEAAITQNKNSIIYASQNLKNDKSIKDICDRTNRIVYVDTSYVDRRPYTDCKVKEIHSSYSKEELLLPYQKKNFSLEEALNDLPEDIKRLKASNTEIRVSNKEFYEETRPIGGTSLSYAGYILMDDFTKKYKEFFTSKRFLKEAISELPELYKNLPQQSMKIIEKDKDIMKTIISARPDELYLLSEEMKALY